LVSVNGSLQRDHVMLPLTMAAVNLSASPDGRMREGQMPAPEAPIPMADSDEIVDQIAGFALFADLETPQLERVAHTFEEQVYAEGERVLRQGLSGSAFHIILDGAAAVVIDGEQRATLSRGDFFGEVSILLGEPPVADVVAVRQLRCLVLAGGQVRAFLLDNPSVMYRMLQAQARRLRNANRWRS
jgi:CRP-like cAMP-binding protein